MVSGDTFLVSAEGASKTRDKATLHTQDVILAPAVLVDTFFHPLTVAPRLHPTPLTSLAAHVLPDVVHLRLSAGLRPPFAPHLKLPSDTRKTESSSFLGETASHDKSSSPPQPPSNSLTVFIEGVWVDALVDTGASVSVIHADLCSRLRKVTTPYDGPALRGANGVMIRPSGFCTARVSIDGIRHHIQFAVLSPCAHQVILGWDFLSSASAIITCRHPTIHIADTSLATVSERPKPRLVATTDCLLSPGEETVLSISSSTVTDGDVLVVPAGNFLLKGVVIPSCLVRFSSGSALIAAVNTSAEPILLPQGATIASVSSDEAVSVLPLSTISTAKPACKSPPPASAFDTAISSNLTPEQKQALVLLLSKHQGSFDAYSSVLGKTSAAAHRIDTDGSCIVRRRPYRVSPSERKVIQENVDDMLQRNIVRPSSSPWSSPVVLVQKRTVPYAFASTIGR